MLRKSLFFDNIITEMDINAQVLRLLFANLPHTPTDGQREAADAIVRFLFDPDPDSAFVLKGYAGTGKTTLVSALIQTLPQLKVRSVLLAPTGRAAKVLSNYSGRQALTIHKKIYATTADANGLLRCSRVPNTHSYTLSRSLRGRRAGFGRCRCPRQSSKPRRR